jgi:Ca2+-binding RTX toxin-like protein
VLIGGGLADTLDGNMGNDTLNGGLGNDSLIGAAGNDHFVFNSELGATNVDTISGYSMTADTILLDDAVFVGIGAAGASLAVSAFTSGPGAVATSLNHRIIYNTTSGALFYDADGSGAGSAVQFATLSGAPALNNTEFLII